MKHTKYLIFNLLVVTSILITACGAPATQDPYIQTAVAQTVAAKNMEQNSTATPAAPAIIEATQTPLQFSPTTTAQPFAPVATSGNGLSSPCAKASLVSETIVDGTIFRPGGQFTKTWEIKNTSPCPWDTNYKIVFWGGDILGGASSYNLPYPVPPGGTIPISLVLAAPATDGVYKSEWALQTPDKVNFGVGEYSASFYLSIVVSAEDKPDYGVTSVTYELERDPPTGCPANVWYYAHATVSVNGPVRLRYYWKQSDGHLVHYTEVITMESEGTFVRTNSWKFYIADSPGPKWMYIVIGVWNGEEYKYVEYPPGVDFVKTCGS